MFFTDTDFSEGDASTHIALKLKSGGAGKLFVQCYASSGASLGVHLKHVYSTAYEGFFSTATIAASVVGLYGYCADDIASGCVGWAQIRGPVDNAQCAAAVMSGSIGHTVRLAASGLWATATATGQSTFNGDASQVAVLREEVDTSTTANIYLVGNMYAEV
ncbi:hypothetical protein LCGC14_2253940 [marine sediment metagenome]|uniref:Uncharacterized protein n=1 Tax=marine sediment metagenome TaxID=412755 RepID=A0A0F9D211_9ZZZZ